MASQLAIDPTLQQALSVYLQLAAQNGVEGPQQTRL